MFGHKYSSKSLQSATLKASVAETYVLVREAQLVISYSICHGY